MLSYAGDKEIFTRHTLVWQGTKFAVFSLSGYRHLGDGGTNWRIILHIIPGQACTLLGMVTQEIPQIRNFGPKFWPFDREYLENGKL